MKIFVLLCIVSFAFAEHSDEDKQAWKSWKVKHGKMFMSKNKEDERMTTFLKNKANCDAHNERFLNGEETFTKQVHKHSDLNRDQFLKRFGGVKMDETTENRTTPITLRASYPASTDLRLSGGVGAIRDQGDCGSCWTFSSCSALEYMYWKKTGYAGDLSEQNLVDCVYAPGPGCSGGWMPKAFTYISTNGGIAWETDYAYTASDGNCKASSIASKSVWLSQATPYVKVASDDDSIKSAIANNGVLSVCVDASEWDSYQSGIYQDNRMSSTKPSCSHAVAIVGYGDASGIPYYIVRNSWNTWWGEQGYIRMDARRYPNGNTYSGLMLNFAYYPVSY